MASAGKPELRAELLARRRARPESDRERARAAVRDHVIAQARTAGWRSVAAYEPLVTEPGSTALLAGLALTCERVVVPILLANRDLDWVQWADGAASGPLLGVDAIARCDAVLVPALAVAPDGTRLGRGGGSYDRALQRCGPRATVIALLFDGELVAELPSDPWDRPVSAVVTPGGFVPVGAPGNTGVGPGR